MPWPREDYRFVARREGLTPFVAICNEAYRRISPRRHHDIIYFISRRGETIDIAIDIFSIYLDGFRPRDYLL